jgi:hypothetical protein
MDNPAKPEVGDPTTLDDVKNKDSHEQIDPVQAHKYSPQEIEEFHSRLKAAPNPRDMVPDMKFLLESFQEIFPKIKGPEQEAPSVSQFFNLTALKVKYIEYSDDDLVEYKLFTQTEGGVGESATMTDYLIATTAQSSPPTWSRAGSDFYYSSTLLPASVEAGDLAREAALKLGPLECQ